MGKIAFVFAGQGAQHPGMGKELFDSIPAARTVFETLDAIRPGTSRQCFEGTEEELRQTSNTQPCLFAVEMAAAAALTHQGIRADMTAGFSLGELSALTYAGSADLETGLRLVMKRGELMQQASEEKDTAMAAVVKLENSQVEALCAGFQEVYPVNYNCPGQVTVSGLASEMPAFSKAVKEAGGRALPLKVRGGFHAPFMAGASAAFGQFLGEHSLSAPTIPLYSNCTGGVYDEDIRGLLEKQICNPVRWETIIRAMIAAGVDTFIELGPGKTLCGLIGKIDPSVRTFPLETKADLDAVLEGVKG